MNGKKRLQNNNYTKEDVRAFAGAVRSLPACGRLGKKVVFLDSAGSTNDEAMKIASGSDEPEGIVVVVDSQTGGRGRMGRRWVSPSGVNLYFTLILKPALTPDEAPVLTLMAAVAAVSAVREFTGINAEIKWPNDIMVNGKKAGGILLDMKAGPDKIKIVAVGIGINVNMDTALLPEDIQSISTSLRLEAGRSIDRAELLGKILEKADEWYRVILKGEKATLLDEWRFLSSTIGEDISVKMHDKIISGAAEDIDEKGALIVRLASGALQTVCAGDVTILKKS